MSKIFLIAGLGADTRIYNNIDLGDNEVIPVDWIEPHKTDTLTTYSQKLIHQYFITDNSIVIGTSLGGMLAIEIAKQVRLNKVILISSIKTVHEAPAYFKFFKAVPVQQFVKWAMDAVLAWKNEVIPANVYHIVGDSDHVFNYKRINNAMVIKGGTHIMVFNKAKEINKLLKGILKKK